MWWTCRTNDRLLALLGYCARYAAKSADADRAMIDTTTGEIITLHLRAWSKSARWGESMKSIRAAQRVVGECGRRRPARAWRSCRLAANSPLISIVISTQSEVRPTCSWITLGRPPLCRRSGASTGHRGYRRATIFGVAPGLDWLQAREPSQPSEKGRDSRVELAERSTGTDFSAGR